jgi:hypothetical protein
MSNIRAALATTTYPHTFDGTNIVSADVASLNGIAEDIFESTVAELPTQGFNLGVGSLLQDMGSVLTFKLTSGLVYLEWRLVKCLTSVGDGATPVGTVGFLPIFVAPGNIVGQPYDPVRAARTG